MSQIMVFWSDREIKIPRNVVIRLNHEINNATKFIFLKKKYREIKIPRRFYTAKTSCLKVGLAKTYQKII